MTRPIQEWHKVHVIQEYVKMTGFHIQLQKRNHHEEPCFSEILQELISDLTQLDSVTNYQEGEMWESLWKNDKQWKGSPNKTQSGTLLNIQFTSTARCNPGCMKKECDLCWEVYSVTGREFAVGLMFVVNYPLDTGIQYSRAAIDLNRFIDLWAEKYHEVARKILPLSSAH